MISDWQSLYASVSPFIPAGIASDLSLIGAFLVSLCAVIARFWHRPAAGSKWLFVYLFVNRIGMNSKHAVNADDTLRVPSVPVSSDRPVTSKPEEPKQEPEGSQPHHNA